MGGLIAGFFLYGIVFFNKESFINTLNNYNLLPKPEPFTELYFEDHLKLPKTIVADNKYPFSFTIHNLEYADVNYKYSITSEASGSATTLRKGAFNLKHDGYKTIKEVYATTEPAVRTKVTVSLDNKKQSIHFWMNK